ncbi:oligosaccharide flippase family protein [Sneathiella sp. P13V-1]|uniref:oligosaccharide flippase family protein n=1 Tax=Sneathiella sp. P13V-1 TaxID=2697366 RepID=UPI00187BC08F|nr:oligosaccharide flippase family protein [Sneathiella sp. P13V-1]MBE7636396.1 oligosaccharide flippase family protein [Sneathiella sp. P13V-1]
MSLFLKGGFTLAFGNTLSSMFGFFRNVLTARLLGVEDYGAASIFALIIAIIELASDIGLDRYIIQKKGVFESKFLSTVHSVSLAKGVASAVLIIVTVPLWAHLMNMIEYSTGLYLLACIPIARSLVHHQIFFQQKQMKFVPVVICGLASQLIAIPVLYLSFVYSADYKSVIVASISQAFVFAITSHIVSNQRYSVVPQKSTLTEIWNFGWPLILNGMLFCLIVNGDKLLISSFFSLEEFGRFSAPFGIVFLGCSILISVVQPLFLSVTSNSMSQEADTNNTLPLTTNFHYLISVSLLIGSVLLLTDITVLFYGNDFTVSNTLIFSICIYQSLRVIRANYNTIFLGLGLSKLTLYMAVVRLSGLVIGLPAVMITGKLETIIVSSCAGEVLSILYGKIVFHRLANRSTSFFQQTFNPLIYIVFSLLTYFAFNMIDEFGYRLLSVVILLCFSLAIYATTIKHLPRLGTKK